MDKTTTPSSWAHLRRTRGALIGVTVLLVLWFILLTFLICATTWHAKGIYADRKSILQIFLSNGLMPIWLGSGVAHYHVGRKLLELARQTNELQDGTPLRPAGEAFSSLWKANLRAHLLLFAFIFVYWMILSQR